MPASLEYHTFSLNPDEPQTHNVVAVEGQPDYLTHGLGLNSMSNRQTDHEENQSFQKQVTGAFNNQFAS